MNEPRGELSTELSTDARVFIHTKTHIAELRTGYPQPSERGEREDRKTKAWTAELSTYPHNPQALIHRVWIVSGYPHIHSHMWGLSTRVDNLLDFLSTSYPHGEISQTRFLGYLWHRA